MSPRSHTTDASTASSLELSAVRLSNSSCSAEIASSPSNSLFLYPSYMSPKSIRPRAKSSYAAPRDSDSSESGSESGSETETDSRSDTSGEEETSSDEDGAVEDREKRRISRAVSLYRL
jgi:hypothetical protein